jgi:amino acid transporter
MYFLLLNDNIIKRLKYNMTNDGNHGFAEHNDKKTPEQTDQDTSGQNVNPDLTVSERKRGAHPGDNYVRKHNPYRHLFRGTGGHLVATPESNTAESKLQRGIQNLKAAFVGTPLFSKDEIHERLTKVKALAVFGSDAISSSAYATQASLVVLMVAGNGALNISFYTALAVAVLLSMVAFSYRQTVYAYPHGGGSYNVSHQNLGQTAGLVAAAALLIDYIMTVAVSIAAGSYAVTSALIAAGYSSQINAITGFLPSFFNLNVILSLFFIGLITLGNLRGIRESGSIFAIPTYLFIFGFSTMLVVGLIKVFTHTLTPATPPPILPIAQPLTLWLILRAFSAGAVAMSGTEAISNGVPIFKPPESKNAAITLTVMASLLGVFFVGVSYLSTHMGLVPGNQSIISQVALAVFGQNAFYYIFQIVTMGVLVIAANTAFADFPRLSSVLARDNFMPHIFSHRGDRLAFSSGILFLGAVSAFVLVLFRGNVDSLIHLYAVGVFLAFSMSDTGMVVHWWKTRGKGWKISIVINGADAILTTSILIIVVITKFAFGAWIIIVLIPAIIPIFLFIRHHYDRVAEQLRISLNHSPPQRIDQFVLVPIDDVNYASLMAMSFARTICKNITVLHIATDAARAEKVQQKMQTYAPDMKLVIVESPLRAFMRPLLTYVDVLHKQHPGGFVTIVLPEFITAHWWERFLHNRTAEQLTQAFKKHPNVAVVLVPYLLKR